MVKFSKVLIILIFSQSVCFSMTNEKLNRFKWKAKNDISIKAIESYEPRAKVLNINTIISPDNHEVRATVTFQVVSTQEQAFVEISLTRLR